jgi:hypothetical protein
LSRQLVNSIVHDRLDRHDERFDNNEGELRGIGSELKNKRSILEDLHALEWIAAIERQLGIDKDIAA